jgi:hypothetical protein
MKWKCTESSFRECYESETEMKRESGYVQNSPAAQRRKEISNRWSEKKHSNLFSNLTNLDMEILGNDIFEAWEKLVTDYSKRHIRNAYDRILTITGVTNVFNRAISTGDSALAGLWKESLLEGLLWRIFPDVDIAKPSAFYQRSILAQLSEQVTTEPSTFLLENFWLNR